MLEAEKLIHEAGEIIDSLGNPSNRPDRQPNAEWRVGMSDIIETLTKFIDSNTGTPSPHCNALAQMGIDARSEIETLQAQLEQERERVVELVKGLKELGSIVRIHSKATDDNFAWAEMEYAEMLLTTHTKGDNDE